MGVGELRFCRIQLGLGGVQLCLGGGKLALAGGDLRLTAGDLLAQGVDLGLDCGLLNGVRNRGKLILEGTQGGAGLGKLSLSLTELREAALVLGHAVFVLGQTAFVLLLALIIIP